MIDTGATLVAIPQKLADKLQLQGRYSIQIRTAAGESSGSLTRIQELNFGGFTLHDVRVVIVPGGDDDTILLGVNILSQFKLLQQDKHLVIEAKP